MSIPLDKPNKIAYAPSEDSDQLHPAQSEQSLLSALRKLGSLAIHWTHSKDWSVWVDAQADLSLLGAQWFFWFCHEAAHIFVHYNMHLRWCATLCSMSRCTQRFEPWHDKTNEMGVRTAKTQISLGISPVWSVFAVRSMGHKVSSCRQQRLWSDWADAQADPSLRWAHSHIVGFVMSRLIYIYIFTVLHIILLVKSWCFDAEHKQKAIL